MFEDLEALAEFYGVRIVDYDFPSTIRGVYHDGVIGINKNIEDYAERRCLIACNMGRHLLRKNKSIVLTEEQENIRAMQWAVMYLMPFHALCDEKKFGMLSDQEFAKALNVTPQFFKTGIELYKNSVGNRVFFHGLVIDLENKKIESLKEVG